MWDKCVVLWGTHWEIEKYNWEHAGRHWEHAENTKIWAHHQKKPSFGHPKIDML
jgi:hypothetical protein